MKNLRQLCAAVVLALALAAPASAGVISTGVTQPPPPTTQGVISTGVTDSPSTQGVISTGVTDQESAEDGATASDSVTEIALTLLQSVLSLF
jgi:hypothetical protein